MTYQHRWIDGREVGWPLGKIVCVGRNYREHAAELHNAVPDRPMLFMKPATSAVSFEARWRLPDRPLHFEAEISVLIGNTLSQVAPDQVSGGLAGVGLALDLTDRALQSELKAKGHPWERAKAFDDSAPLTSFLPLSDEIDLTQLVFSFAMAGQIRQADSSASMVFSIVELISDISQCFTLHAGDVVLTGTPAGVGELDACSDMVLTLAKTRWLRSFKA